MIKREDSIVMKAIALCFKPYLKPEEAQIYCDLGKTQLAKKCDDSNVYKTSNGYYRKEEIDLMLEGKTKQPKIHLKEF